MDAYLLEVKEGTGKPKLVPLHRTPLRIGRDPTNELTLSDPVVSRHHASIVRDQQGLQIVDHRSRNGVLLNSRRIEGRASLRPGDVVTIGPFQMRLSLSTRPGESMAFQGEKTIDFFPPQPPLAPLENLGLTAPSGGESARRIPWNRLLRLLVSDPTPRFYDLILEMVSELTSFDRCFLILLEDGSPDTLEIVARRFGPRSLSRNTSQVYASREILNQVVTSRRAVSISSRDTNFVPSQSFVLSGACSLLCVPLTIAEKVVGVLYIDRLAGEPFSVEAARKLAPLAGLVALKIENIRLLEAQVEARVNARELEVARTVQEGFLPRRSITSGAYTLDAYSRPGQQVGGDCLDIIDSGTGRYTLAVGDVTGRGLPAALYMVGVLSTLRAYVGQGGSLSEILSRLSSYVEHRFRPDHFLSLLLAELDTETGVFTYCNAGHLPPLVLSSGGDISELEAGDPALNITPWDEFRTYQWMLKPGDLLIIYTDGVTELEGNGGEYFGKERLVKCVSDSKEEALEDIRGKILESLESFSPGRAKRDDTTFVLLRRQLEMPESDIGALPEPGSDTIGETRQIYSRKLSSQLEEREGVITEILDLARARGLRRDPYFPRLCLDEALSNAILHGNLEDPDAEVTVTAFSSTVEWGVEISDEGTGFDWREWFERLEKERDAEKPTGRGLDLIRKCTDRVEFLGGGRTIRMTWRVEKADGARQD